MESSDWVLVLVSASVGGLAAGMLKFFFEDLVRPVVNERRGYRVLRDKYTAPLLHAAESLERRLSIHVRHGADPGYSESEYYRLSTLFLLGRYLSWTRIIEREFGFLPFGSVRQGRRFGARFVRPFRSISSLRIEEFVELGPPEVGSAVPRLILSGAGEVMTTTENGASYPMEFSEFVDQWPDPRFRRWFVEIERFLASPQLADEQRLYRLILLAAELRMLARLLDPRGKFVQLRIPENLELIRSAEVRNAISAEWKMLTGDTLSIADLGGT